MKNAPGRLRYAPQITLVFAIGLSFWVRSDEAVLVKVSRAGSDRIAIEWSAEPGKTYEVRSASTAIGPWLLQMSSRIVEGAGFFQVTEIPTNAAESFRRFSWIPPGTFVMGSPATEVGREEAEGPQTEVTISRGFWLSKYEVTQAEWRDLMGTTPSFFKGDTDRPVERVSWSDATHYCAKLTDRERLAGRLLSGFEYRLPTEAQWEYACRAGTTNAFAFGDTLSSGQANYASTARSETTWVGLYRPNAWALHDMHGNVAEWCLDGWGLLPGGNIIDPLGDQSGGERIMKGGSWGNPVEKARSAARSKTTIFSSNERWGFRVALVPVD